MKRKANLSREQINKIVIQEIKKAVEDGRLDEGIWDSLKNAAAKLGSLEKGGKVFGRGKRDTAAQAQAEKSMENIKAKAGAASEQLIGKMQGTFKEAGYPNQKDKEEFISQTGELETFYKSIVKANEQSPEKMPAILANEIIGDLRVIVKRFLDYELADIYKHFNEEADPYVLEEGWEDEMERQAVEAGEKEGPISKGKDSTTMKGLKSNVLPMILAALGGTSLLADIFVKSQIFKDLTTKIVTTPGTPAEKVESIKKIVNTLGPADGEGMTQMVARLSGDNLTPQSTMDDFFAAANKLGISPANLEAVGTELGADPGAYANAAKQAGTATLQDVFGQDQSFWLDQGASAKTIILKKVTKVIAGKAAKSVATTTAVGKLGALAGPFLAPLGIGLLASAAAVKALRVKGQKSSRAQILNDLLQSLDDVSDQTSADPQAPGQEPGEAPGQAPGQAPGSTDAPKQITQQDQLPVPVDTTADLATVADPNTPADEKAEIVQGLSDRAQQVKRVLTLTGLPDDKIEQILQDIEAQDTEGAAESMEDVAPKLDAGAKEAMDDEAEKLPVPTGTTLQDLRSQFEEAGLKGSDAGRLSRIFAGPVLQEELPTFGEEQEAEDPLKIFDPPAAYLVRAVKNQQDEEMKRLIMRFAIKRTYDFRNTMANTKEKKINVVRNVKTILRKANADPAIAAITRAILTANPDNLNAKQVQALRKTLGYQQAAKDAEPEQIENPELTPVAEARRKSNEDRLRRLTEGLAKKRIR